MLGACFKHTWNKSIWNSVLPPNNYVLSGGAIKCILPCGLLIFEVVTMGEMCFAIFFYRWLFMFFFFFFFPCFSYLLFLIVVVLVFSLSFSSWLWMWWLLLLFLFRVVAVWAPEGPLKLLKQSNCFPNFQRKKQSNNQFYQSN